MSSQTVTVSQKVVVPDDNYHYKLPVVFHVIYSSKSNTKQYVKTGWLETILADVNKLYKSSGVDLNLEFVLATEDPDGNGGTWCTSHTMGQCSDQLQGIYGIHCQYASEVY